MLKDVPVQYSLNIEHFQSISAPVFVGTELTALWKFPWEEQRSRTAERPKV